MTHKICPTCEAKNAIDNSFCGSCGGRLERELRAPGAGSELAAAMEDLLPAVSAKQVGQAVAVSLLALAAEAGLSWLRRRVADLDAPGRSSTEKRSSLPIIPRESPLRRRPVKTIVSQRTVQLYEDGRLKGQGTTQSVWQVEE
ncbi:MAG: hypothetical protein R3272_06040 [Candidatus Promineifilaceae bacterium]|nr:hypothetical protein [Candidatus Promineifilaceae bacterium]